MIDSQRDRLKQILGMVHDRIEVFIDNMMADKDRTITNQAQEIARLQRILKDNGLERFIG